MKELLSNEESSHDVQRMCSSLLEDMGKAVLHAQVVTDAAEKNTHILTERVRYAEMRLDRLSSGRSLAVAYEHDVACMQRARHFQQAAAHILARIEEHASLSQYNGAWISIEIIDQSAPLTKELFALTQQLDALLDLVCAAVADDTLTDRTAQDSLSAVQNAVRYGHTALYGAETVMMKMLYD